jgi:hypothetical protein
MNEIRKIVNGIRMDHYKSILQRVKFNAYADRCSSYSAKKLNLYNIRVKEMV